MASQRQYPGQGYMANGAISGHIPPPTATPLLPNNGRVTTIGGVRVLCVADVRGNLASLNEIAASARADHIIHTGDFGFYDDTSLDRIADKTLKHVAQYSPLISEATKKAIQQPGISGPVKTRFAPSDLPLSELPQFLNGNQKLNVPVYTVWGACEDVRVLEKFRSTEYKVPNLHIISEARSMLLEIGGVKLRLLGLGGAVVMHKLFDNGEGRTTIAGGQGTMWNTFLQMGELIDTANRVYDPTETRVFITHASPAREGILNQLSVTLKADFSISAGLHFRYGSSYNEFSVNPTLDHYRGKLAASRASFSDVWETVKNEVEPAIQQNESQQTLLNNALELVEKMPTTAHGGNPFGGPVGGANASQVGQVDESAFKNMWNFNLADAAYGWLVLEIQDGRIGTEMRAQGFNFSHRGSKQNPLLQQQTQTSVVGAGTSAAANPVASTPTGPAQNRTPNAPSGQAPAGPSVQRAQQSAQQQPWGPAGRTPDSQTPFQHKPATPQPAVSGTGSNENEKTTTATTNGNATNGVAENVVPPATRSTPEPVYGLFVMNVNSEEAVRDLFSNEADRKNIVKVEKHGISNRVVHFKSAEDRDAAMSHLPEELKTRTKEDRSTPLVKNFEPRPRQYDGNRGVGSWGSSRGGRDQPSASRGGYASAGGGGGGGGGGASDSDGGRGRGRGTFRGSRGDRGNNGRGSGRGTRKPTDGATPSPATAAATPASTDIQGSW